MEQSFGSPEGRGDQDGCLIAPTSGAVRLTHSVHRVADPGGTAMLGMI